MKKLAFLALLLTAANAQFVASSTAKASWGPVRGVYVDPSRRDVRLVFESADGTIRVGIMDTTTSHVWIVAEIERGN